MQHSSPPLLGFAAASGTGKTTLLTQLIPLLNQHGLRVALIKHSHHDFEIDKPGKDSFRLRAAGASPVLLVSAYRRAMVTEFVAPIQPRLAEQLLLFDPAEVDLILVEGFKAEVFAKIELHRTALDNPLLYPSDAEIIAVASDGVLQLPAPLVALDLNNPKQIAAFILESFLGKNVMNDVCGIEPGLLSVDAAIARIKNSVSAIAEYEVVELKQALGRVLSAPVTAQIDLPRERNSAMDGYAFASAEINGEQGFSLKKVGTSWAGRPFVGRLNPGECVRIFTGAVLPESADSVMMQEKVTVIEDTVVFPPGCRALQNVRDIGEDVQQHSVLLNAPKKLQAADLGLLAAAGVSEVAVFRKLKIAFLSTGDELIPLGQPLATGQIYDSNRYMLHGLLTDPCFEIIDGGVVADDKTLIQKTLLAIASQADVLITTGGASVGEADYIQEILAESGKVDFWKIAMKPGKPLAFGKLGECVFFGLPGNPVAVLATFEKLVKPALRKLCAEPETTPLQLQATCQSRLKKSPGRQEYQRGILTQIAAGEFEVISAGGQGSNILSAMSRANCYIVLPSACAGVEIGETVLVELFDAFISVDDKNY